MVSTTELVEKVYAFCEAVSGKKLFPYQSQPAKRLIRSLLEGDGEVLTTLWCRQSGKSFTTSVIATGVSIILPILANMPMFANDKRLMKFKNGFLLGIFAPALHQAQIIFGNIKKHLMSDSAAYILSDPEISVGFDTFNGQNITLRFNNLGIASSITCMSASENSNVVGQSYMLIICDESQDIGNAKYKADLSPMGAFYNATHLLIGTPGTTKGFFHDLIEKNKDDYKKGARYKSHYEYDCDVVMRYNDDYAKYITKEKKTLGETSDEFLMSYCVTPDTRILTADLKWSKAESIKVGDNLIGFEEFPSKRYSQRRFKKSIVEDVGRIVRPCYKITLDDGTVVKCSEEHQWLVFTAGGRTEWTCTKDLTSYDRIYRPLSTWNNDLDNDYRIGYLSAAFDGEGHVSQINGSIGQVCFTQKNNVMMEKVKQYLTELGFKYGETFNEKTNVAKIYLLGGRDAYFKFLGIVRPERILAKFDLKVTGTLRYCGHTNTGFSHPLVIKKEFIGDNEVIPIRTTTRTYIAEGLASHNCLKWLFERGMFVDADKFDRLGDETRGRIFCDHINLHVVGIDLGKAQDSTVVTVGEIDLENPIIVEENKEKNIPGYTTYQVAVKDWMEIVGDNWDEQYYLIKDYLTNFRIHRIVMDATGVGSAIYDRLNNAVNCEIIPYVFGLQSKSDLYKHFDNSIKAGHFSYPADLNSAETPEFRKFKQQMLDVEKSYNGQHMVVKAPAGKNNHDDYCDSSALMVWAAKGELITPETGKSNPFLETKSQQFYTVRNRITARRR